LRAPRKDAYGVRNRPIFARIDTYQSTCSWIRPPVQATHCICSDKFKGGGSLLLRRAFTPLAAILLLAPCDGVFAGQLTTSDMVANSAGPSNAEEPPPGGCLPIGVTASGEIVFPFLCKDFLERNKGAAAKPPTDEAKPASEKTLSSEQSPSPESKVGSIQSEKSEPEIGQPAPIQVDTVSSIDSSRPASKDGTKKKTRLSSRDCTHYRSFDPASDTYRDFSGHRRPCRP